MTAIEHGPRGGELITVNDVPYELRSGLTKAAIIERTGKPKGWRCRQGWHKFETIGEPATLAMIGAGASKEAVELTSLHGRFYTGLEQCERCGELGRHFR